MKQQDVITILGYGSQGRAIALNLKDSGYTVTVGLRKHSRSAAVAQGEGIPTASIREAAATADIIVVAIPDHVQQKVLRPSLFAAMKKRPALVFLHGSAIHFGLVTPPEDMPVLLLAPHAPGLAVRANYLNKKPYSAFYAVYQGHKKRNHRLLTNLAGAIGIPDTHLIRTTFAVETVGDLFGEQAVLCGGLARLLKYGFETLVEAGLPPQNAYLEVAFQLDLIVDLIKKHGLTGMFERISPMARYGSLVNGPRAVPASVKGQMKKVLAEIESGAFIRKARQSGFRVTKRQMSALTNASFDWQAKKYSPDE